MSEHMEANHNVAGVNGHLERNTDGGNDSKEGSESTGCSFDGVDQISQLDNNDSIEVDTFGGNGKEGDFIQHNVNEEIQRNSVSFASSLKGWDNNSTTIVSFNDILFNSKCRETSPTHDPSIDSNIVVEELFKENEDWVDMETLYQAVKSVGKVLGFHITKKQKHIQCNRFGIDQSKRNYTEGSLLVGCTFRITLKAHQLERYVLEGKTKSVAKRNWNHPVTIKSSCCRHGGQCYPGRQNRITAMKRRGHFIDSLPQNVMFTLSGRLSSDVMKRVLEPVMPCSKNLTNKDLFNVRVRVMRLLPSFCGCNGDYSEFKSTINGQEILDGIENDVTINDNEALELAQSIWMDVMSLSRRGSDDEFMTFIEYMALIKQQTKGFVYEYGKDSSGKIIGVMWMTATIRRNFELFGSYISLDFMKRALNSLLWPYVSVAMYNELRQICVGCEGILLGEKKPMYQFLCQFLRTNAPGRSFKSVKVVAGDVFFTQDMILELGFVNATFIYDRWHLLDSGLKGMFPTSYELLKSHLVSMVHASSESNFEQILLSANNLLQVQTSKNIQDIEDLHIFQSIRGNYAEYKLNKIPGNRGLHVSAVSEQNHSSVLQYLNDGYTGKNMYYQHPITLIKDLLHHQKYHINKTNGILFGQAKKLEIEILSLKKNQTTVKNQQLLRAARRLNFFEYECHKSEWQHADSKHELIDTDGNFPMMVKSIRNPDAPVRIFTATNDQCKCDTRIAQERTCIHEIKWKRRFKEYRFQPRHFCRDHVEGSLQGWEACTEIETDLMMEYQEDIMMESQNCSIVEESDVADVDAVALDPPNASNLPPGYLHDTSNSIKPLDIKTLKLILLSVAGGYTRCSKEAKFAISSLAIQMEKLLLHETDNKSPMEFLSQASVNEDYNKREVEKYTQTIKPTSTAEHEDIAKPPSNAFRLEPKLWLKPAHEICQKKKFKSIIQNAGVAQTITNGKNAVIANGKTSHKMTCAFCSDNHPYTSCPKRDEHKLTSMEYILTTKQPIVKTSIRQRLSSMPMITSGMKRSVFADGLAKRNYIQNFVIHECHKMEDTNNTTTIDDRGYCVSFFNSDGTVEGDCRVFISRLVMNELVCHNKVIKKFLYDETFFFQRFVGKYES